MSGPRPLEIPDAAVVAAACVRWSPNASLVRTELEAGAPPVVAEELMKLADELAQRAERTDGGYVDGMHEAADVLRERANELLDAARPNPRSGM